MESESSRVVGMDCAEEVHVAVLLNEDGDLEETVEVPNNQKDIQEVLGRFLLRVSAGTKLRVAVESQRSHGRLVADCARSMGCELVQVNPTVLDRFRKVEGVSNKTDVLDAFLIARIAFFGHGGVRDAVEYTAEERAIQRLKDLSDQITLDRSRAILRLRALMLEVLPELLCKGSGLPAVDSRSMLGILERWPGFEGLDRASVGSIVQILRQHRSRGDRDAVARTLKEMVRKITMPQLERRALSTQMTHQAKRILQCTEELARIEAELRAGVRRDPDGVRLLKMPGVGIKTAAVLLGWYRPIVRHSTEAQAAAYSGVTPVSRQSGKSLRKDRLSRRTNKKILHALYMSAFASLKCSAIDRAYYEKKKQSYAGHPTPHPAALIALARQRIKVMYRILALGEDYDKEKLIAAYMKRQRASQEAVA